MMGGYAPYIFASYGMVCACLLIHWILPWRKWRLFLRKKSCDERTS